MLYLERWGKERFKLLVIMSQAVAVLADVFYNMMTWARERRYEELTALVDDKERFRALYSNPDLAFWVAGMAVHSKVFTEDDLQKARLEADKIKELIPVLLEKATEKVKEELTDKIDLTSLETLKESAKAFEKSPDESYKKHLEWLKTVINDEDIIVQNEEKLIKLPEIIFLVRVLIPCWLEYGQTAGELLNLAKSGDLSALKKLMRLDERFLEVPELRELFYTHKNSLVPKGQEALALSLAEEPEKNLTPQRIRHICAAFIMHISNMMADYFDQAYQDFFDKVFMPLVPRKQRKQVQKKFKRKLGSMRRGYKFTTPDLRDLFNAAVKDKQHDKYATDLFISINDHAFYTAVKRELGFWQSLAPVSHK